MKTKKSQPKGKIREKPTLAMNLIQKNVLALEADKTNKGAHEAP